jgi:thiol:disulfide interchange protein DsbC
MKAHALVAFKTMLGQRRCGPSHADCARRRKPPSARTWPNACRSCRRLTRSPRAPMPGLFEVRINGTEIFYTDAEGNYLIQGSLIDTRAATQPDRGAHRQALGHRFRQPAAEGCVHDRARQRQAQARGVRGPELRLLQALRARPAEGGQRDGVHVPVPDPGARTRLEKSQATSGAPRTRPRPGSTGWCATRPRPPPAATPPALTRNIEFGRKHKITGTPTLIFADGSRVPGAINSAAGREVPGGSQVTRHPRPAPWLRV